MPHRAGPPTRHVTGEPVRGEDQKVSRLSRNWRVRPQGVAYPKPNGGKLMRKERKNYTGEETGGGGGSRTRVRKRPHRDLYVRSPLI